MENKIEIIEKINEKNRLANELVNLIYGSVEIRTQEGKKYIYVHFRDDGLPLTKYVGEYTDDLYNLILNNNIRAKAIKKDLRKLEKELHAAGVVEQDLDEKVALNIDFARKNMVNTIFKQAVLEGIATTYADTETIIEGGKVRDMTATDILKVVNLKHAWELILNKGVITSPTNFALLCDINRLIEQGFYYNAGKLRSTPVSIGGTKWKPELPVESQIKDDLDKLINSKLDIVDKAIELLLYVMKKQIFLDGNKRTAVIIANHLLISHAKGLIAIPNENVDTFRDLLIDYYEGKDEIYIKEFLKNKAYQPL